MDDALTAPPGLKASRPAGSAPRVTWFELFYDLVVIAAVANGSHLVAQEQSFSLGLWLILTFVITFVLWFSTSLIINLSPGGLPWGHGLMFAQMVAITLANLALSRTEGLADSWGFAGLAVAFASVAAMYAIAGRRTPDLRAIVMPGAWGMGAAAIVLALGALVPEVPSAVSMSVLLGGVIIGAAPIVVVVIPRVCRMHRLDPHHLSERLGQFVIIVLGESFLALTLMLTGMESVPGPMSFVLALLVAGSLWVIYFETIAPGGIPGSPARLLVWLAAFMVFLVGVGYSASLHAVYAARDWDAMSDGHPFTPLPAFYAITGALLLSAIGGRARHGAPIRIHAAALGVLALAWGTLILLGATSGSVLMAMSSAVVIGDALTSLWWHRSHERRHHPASTG